MAKHLFSDAQQKQIVDAIKKAELNTSGEIQVHLESRCKKDVLDRAAVIFAKLKLHETKDRNGVLFYLAVEDHKFAILGDAGINSTVEADFWDKIKSHMQQKFKAGEFTEGLCEGIQKAGEQLKANFPYSKNDVNEISDDISFGQN